MKKIYFLLGCIFSGTICSFQNCWKSLKSAPKKFYFGYGLGAASMYAYCFSKKINPNVRLLFYLPYFYFTRLAYNSYLKETLFNRRYSKKSLNMTLLFMYVKIFVDMGYGLWREKKLSFSSLFDYDFLDSLTGNKNYTSLICWMFLLNPALIIFLHEIGDKFVEECRIFKKNNKEKLATREKKLEIPQCAKKLILFNTIKKIEENLLHKTPLEAAAFLFVSLSYVSQKNSRLANDKKLLLKEYFDPKRYQGIYNMFDKNSSVMTDSFKDIVYKFNVQEKELIEAAANNLSEKMVAVEAILRNFSSDDQFTTNIKEYFQNVENNQKFSISMKSLSEFIISLSQFALIIKYNKKLNSIEDPYCKSFCESCSLLIEKLVPKNFIRNNWYDFFLVFL